MSWRFTASGDVLGTTSPPDHNAPYSASLWFLYEDLPGDYHNLLALADASGTNMDGVQLDNQANLTLTVTAGATIDQQVVSGALSGWHHVAIVRESTSLLRVYLDGAEVGTSTVDVTSRSAAAVLSVGAVFAGGGNYWPIDAYLDCLKVWDEAVDASVVRSAMSSRAGCPNQSSPTSILDPTSSAARLVDRAFPGRTWIESASAPYDVVSAPVSYSKSPRYLRVTPIQPPDPKIVAACWSTVEVEPWCPTVLRAPRIRTSSEQVEIAPQCHTVDTGAGGGGGGSTILPAPAGVVEIEPMCHDVVRGTVVSATSGIVAVSGQAALRPRAPAIVVPPAAVAVDAQDAEVLRAPRVLAPASTVSVDAQDAEVLRAPRVLATVGAVIVDSPCHAVLRAPRVLAPTAAVAIVGQPASRPRAPTIAAALGYVEVRGFAGSARAGTVLDAPSSSVEVAPQCHSVSTGNAGGSTDLVLHAPASSVEVAGGCADVRVGRVVAAPPSSTEIAGQPASVPRSPVILAPESAVAVDDVGGHCVVLGCALLAPTSSVEVVPQCHQVDADRPTNLNLRACHGVVELAPLCHKVLSLQAVMPSEGLVVTLEDEVSDVMVEDEQTGVGEDSPYVVDYEEQ